MQSFFMTGINSFQIWEIGDWLINFRYRYSFRFSDIVS